MSFVEDGEAGRDPFDELAPRPIDPTDAPAQLDAIALVHGVLQAMDVGWPARVPLRTSLASEALLEAMDAAQLRRVADALSKIMLAAVDAQQVDYDEFLDMMTDQAIDALNR